MFSKSSIEQSKSCMIYLINQSSLDRSTAITIYEASKKILKMTEILSLRLDLATIGPMRFQDQSFPGPKPWLFRLWAVVREARALCMSHVY